MIPPKTVSKTIDIPEQLAQRTQDLVVDTANAMGAKLFKSQEKYGYRDCWVGSNWTREECLRELKLHLEKGDPIDSINYLAFMLENGWSTEGIFEDENS